MKDILTPLPDPLIVRFLDSETQQVQEFDFNQFGKHLNLASAFAVAFYETQISFRANTRNTNFYNLRQWFKYLDELTIPVITVQEITAQIIAGFIEWIDRNNSWKNTTKQNIYVSVKAILKWLCKKYKVHMEFWHKPYSGIDLKKIPSAKLNKSELIALRRAALTEIKQLWSDFQKGQQLLTQSIITPDNDRPDIRDLGTLLSFIKKKFNGVVPSTVELSKLGFNFLNKAISHHGGTEKISRYLHATVESLLPYMIIIASETFANPDALRLFHRDCIIEHPLYENRVIIRWNKGRSTQQQQRTFLRDKLWGVPQLIKQVMELTAPLLPYVYSSERQYLFIARSIARESNGSGIRIGLTKSVTLNRAVKRFLKRHSLCDQNRNIINFKMEMLRGTGLTIAYQEQGHDIIAVQRLAGHVSPNTTVNYIKGPETAFANDQHIAHLQAKFVDAIRIGKITPQELQNKIGLDRTNALAILAGRNATMSGFTCKDPYAGIALGQQKGKLCSHWLGCFTCKNAVIPLDPMVLAQILHLRNHIEASRSEINDERWNLLYSPIVEIIERDILPKFPMEIMIEAQSIETTLSSLPNIITR